LIFSKKAFDRAGSPTYTRCIFNEGSSVTPLGIRGSRHAGSDLIEVVSYGINTDPHRGQSHQVIQTYWFNGAGLFASKEAF